MTSGGGTWRITDGDREAAVQALGEHYATGRLDKAEYDERSALAWEARTYAEVTPLFTDLPEPHGNVVAVPRAAQPVGAPVEVTRSRGPHPRGWPAGRRGPAFFPWVFLIVPAVVILHAPWLILVGFLVLLVLRPARHWH